MSQHSKAKSRMSMVQVAAELARTDLKTQTLFEWERLRDDLQPIWHLIHDDSIGEIPVNPDCRVFFMSRGVLRACPEVRISAEQVNAAGHKIAARYQNTTFSRQRPTIDARLPDGSRVALVHGSCSVGGPTMTIRKFARHILSLDQMVGMRSMPEAVRQQLVAIVQEQKNVLISGATNSGKTTLLGALVREIDVADVIDYVVHLCLYRDGVRRVRELVTVNGYENGQFELKTLFAYEIQYTPVDCIATVRTPQACSHSAKRCKSSVKHPNVRTGCASRGGPMAT